MPVAETSVENYQLHRDSGQLTRQQLVLLKAMKRGYDYSRAELAELTGMRLSSVCGRVNELLNMTPPYLCEAPTRPCKVTGRTVRPVFRMPDLFLDLEGSET